MAISGISSNTPTTASNSGLSAMTSDDFLKVMLTELQHQDPTKPTDTNAILEQMSSLRNIQSQVDLQSQLSALVLQNQAATAGNLIGKAVQGLDDSNNSVSGLVTSVKIDQKSKNVTLELDGGQTLSMSRLTAIADGGALTGTPTGNSSTSNLANLLKQLAAAAPAASATP